jgi:hypothetical protein
MDRLDISSMRAEWDTMMAEYEGDNNHDHFQRTPEFAQEVAERFSQVSPAMRQEFLDFLISSLTSEFSGCILYNEIFRNVDNPDIKQLMRFMARDESRHASFINQSLKDFGLGIDLGSLRPTPTSSPSTSSTRPICRKRSAMRVTSPSIGNWRKTLTSGFTRSSDGSSAGATTNSAMVNPSH